MVAAVFSGLTASVVYEAKYKSECRIAFAQSNKTAEEIQKICGK